MQICSVGERGSERPALIDNSGVTRDVSSLLVEWAPEHLLPGGLDTLRAFDVAKLPMVPPNTRFGVPMGKISKYVCIGLNYRDHATESGMDAPEEPIVFMKSPGAICGANDDTIIPPGSTKLDWEVELGVVIGSETRNVGEADVLEHVFGYCLLNDISERAFQLQSSQWDKGKGCDTFGPVGPIYVEKQHISDPQNLDLWLSVNGQLRQTGNTQSMIFTVKQIVSYLSRYMTLFPGDIIATGTPRGVGMGMRPEPVWLSEGDVVELGATGLGQQRQKIVRREK